jgi:phosphoribosylformylglycinamidine cyclo-ligase
VISKNTTVLLDSSLWEIPPLMKLIKIAGRIDTKEMLRTFNCGIGMVLVISEKDTDGVLGNLKRLGERAKIIGEVKKREKGSRGILIK